MPTRPLAGAIAIAAVLSSTIAVHGTSASSNVPGVVRGVNRDAGACGFEENVGQYDSRVAFAARRGAATLFVTADGALIGWQSAGSRKDAKPRDAFVAMVSGLAPGLTPPSTESSGFVAWRFRGANGSVRPTGENEMCSAVRHRIRGTAAGPRTTTIRTFRRVHELGLYDGIDALTYDGPKGFEYDLIVHPGADPNRIAMEIDGASSIAVDALGALVLDTPAGAIRHEAPVAFQERDGIRELVSCRFQIGPDRTVRFVLGGYDPARELVIDPVILSTMIFGGTNAEFAYNVATDGAGNSYLGGTTYSLDFPTIASRQGSLGGNADAYVVKVGPDGRTPLWTTYIGGAGNDTGAGIAVDGLGRVYLSGTTTSSAFPVTAGAFQTQLRGGSDAFLVRLSADGQGIEYGTFLGGTGGDTGNGLALDSSMNVAVIGTTVSTNFPVKNGFQPTIAGGQDSYVTVVNDGGSSLAYSTYVGGSMADIALAVDADSSGNVYLAGFTQSPNFPVLNGFQSSFHGGTYDTFMLKLTPAGAFAYGSYLGGSGNDIGYAVAADDDGNAYVAGFTESSDFPVVDALQATMRGGSDGFLALLPTTAAVRLPINSPFSTYYGGDGLDGIYGLQAFDGYVFGIGRTNSGASFPAVNQIPGTTAGPLDPFFTVFERDGSGLNVLASSTVGNGSNIAATGIAVPVEGPYRGVPNLYGSIDFPTTGISDGWFVRAGGDYSAEPDLKVEIYTPPISDTSSFVGNAVVTNKGNRPITIETGGITFKDSTFSAIGSGTSSNYATAVSDDRRQVDYSSTSPLPPGQSRVIVTEGTFGDDQSGTGVLTIVGAAGDGEGIDVAPADNARSSSTRHGPGFNPGSSMMVVPGPPPVSPNFIAPPPAQIIVVDDSVVLKAPLGPAAKTDALRVPPNGSVPGTSTASSSAVDRLRYPGPTRGYNIYASTTPAVTPSQANFYRFVPYDQPFTDLGDAPDGAYFVVTTVYGNTESAPSGVLGGPAPDASGVKVTASKLTVDGANFGSSVNVFIDGIPFLTAAKLKKNNTRIVQKGLLATHETIGTYRQRRGRVLVTITTAAGSSVHFYLE